MKSIYKKRYLLFLILFTYWGNIHIYSQSLPNIELIHQMRPANRLLLFSPDNKYVVSANYQINTFSFNSGKLDLIHNYETKSKLTSINFLNDGKYLAASTENGDLLIYSFEQGILNLHKKVKISKVRIRTVSISNNYKNIIIADDRDILYIYSFIQGDLIQTKNLTLNKSLDNITFLESSEQFVIGTSDSLYFYSISTKENSRKEVIHTKGKIVSLTSTEDGKYLYVKNLVSTGNKPFNFYKEFLFVYKHINNSYQLIDSVSDLTNIKVFINPHNKLSVISRTFNTTEVYTYRNEKFEKLFSMPKRGYNNFPINSVTFSSDGKNIIIASDDIHSFMIENCKIEEISTFKDYSPHIWSVDFNSDQSLFVIGSSDKTASVYKINGIELNLIGTIYSYHNIINSVNFSDSGNYLAVNPYNDYTYIYSVTDSIRKSEFLRDSLTTVSVDFSPNGSYFVAGTFFGDVSIYKKQNGSFKIHSKFNDHGSIVNSVSFSNNGKFLATCSDSRTVDVYLIKNDKFDKILTLKDKFDNYGYGIQSICFSKDDSLFAFGTENGSVIIYKIVNNEFNFYKRFSDHDEQVNSIQFSENGKYMLTGSSDRNVNIYEIKNNDWKLIKVLKDHLSDVRAVSISIKNNLIITAGMDGTLVYKIK